MTYYRVHSASTVDQLLDPSHQISRVWTGCVGRHCEACDGHGGETLSVDDGDDYDGWEDCPVCKGEGWVQIEQQAGVSVCRSLSALARYFGEREADLDDCVVVELDGRESDEDDVDSAAGALLVFPTRIVRVLSLADANIS